MPNYKAQFLGEIAKYYNVTVDTLKDWLKVFPNTYNKVEDFKKNNQRILPPMLVKEIYEALGEK